MTDENKIKTFVFINVGVTGIWEVEGALSRVKLVTKPVSRDELSSGDLTLGNIEHFMMEMDEDKYEEGKSLLKYDLTFSETEAQRLISYLNGLPKPVCLVSYNGYRLSYPIIRNAIGHLGHTLPDGVLCADYMQASYEIEDVLPPQQNRDSGALPWSFQRSKTWLSYLFKDLYERQTGLPYQLPQHRPIRQGETGIAEEHVKYLIKCVTGVMLQPFIQWVDRESSVTVFNEGSLLPHQVPDY